jgi:hypothetical protein
MSCGQANRLFAPDLFPIEIEVEAVFAASPGKCHLISIRGEGRKLFRARIRCERHNVHVLSRSICAPGHQIQAEQHNGCEKCRRTSPEINARLSLALFANVHLHNGSAIAPEPPQVSTQFRGTLIPKIRVFFQGFADDLIKLWRELGVQSPQSQRFLVENRILDGAAGFSSEGTFSCRHFIQHYAQGKKIRPSIERLAQDLLR